MRRSIELLALLTILTGCADKLAVTYDCQPAGAVLYSGGENMGRCPQTLYYTIKPEYRESGEVPIQGVMARWPSGAKMSTKSRIMASLRNGTTQRLPLIRPRGPGYAEDARYGLAYERNQILQDQAASQRRTADAATLLYWEKVWDDAFPSQLRNQPSCSSQAVGDRILTNCY